MDILVIGGGGREHAVCEAIKKSKRAGRIFCAPGNAGIAQIAKCVNIAATDLYGIVDYLDANPVDLVVVTPDDPLAAGLVDMLEHKGIPAFGPLKSAAEIESSKAFAKNLMKKYDIPTGKFEIFTDIDSAISYLETSDYPIVVKASGLALGKGVIIANDYQSAKKAVTDMMQHDRFGKSGHTIVIEEFLQGPEVTVLAFTDGKTIKTMPSSQDHKRALDNDMGENTGGMGAFTPSSHYTKQIDEICMEKIYIPLIRAMEKEGRTFKGVLYFQMMLTKDGPKIIEFNARFGDPETQVLLPLLKTDILDIFEAIIDSRLDEIDIQWEQGACATVVIASGGYPGSYEKGFEITGIDKVIDVGLICYHMGTTIKEGNLVTNGGRVLSITAIADTVEQAVFNVYNNIGKISFNNMHFRKDIGTHEIGHTRSNI